MGKKQPSLVTLCQTAVNANMLGHQNQQFTRNRKGSKGDARFSPTQSLPTILVPATEDLTTGTVPASSASSTLQATPVSERETEHTAKKSKQRRA